MQVMELLDRFSADYKVSEHRPAFSAQRMAHEEHVHGMNVAKPVVVKADGQDYMCVLPACCRINFEALKSVLGVEQVELADEAHLSELFADCQLGAEPPFGSFYGLPTIMDDRLEDDEYIVFQGGTHDRAIRMGMAEYKRIESPRIFSFSYRA